MMPLLTDKVAVITGGGGALGAGIAQGLAQAGAAVVLADVNVDAAQQVAAGIQQQAVLLPPVGPRKPFGRDFGF